ncbi:GrpB protein-domain-containing protein [Kockovaella imperatae]|uniref:GrpB protein-domain-containing protein n=1 Tax=Kockovaella imperatae TaxID=4999 RepID=A0A1Y1UID4_9TREE|nr:GrpB protein-domain-containing protein [Kockovaella imperatae]ORX36855.1 GrpB protein-domain-containing protein [Kockovaella imperatae]
MLQINVVPYNPEWPAHFEFIRAQLDDALADFLPKEKYEIIHVGSTSIPGLAAKPIIDLDIVVDAEDIMEATMALTANGYTYAYEANGIDRMVFRYDKHALDSGASKPTEDGTPRRAVYLNKRTGAALLNHLIVQRTLMNDPELRKEYGDVKLELVGEHSSIGAYGGKKNPVLSKILEKGATPEELRYIRSKPKRRIDEKLQAARKARIEADEKRVLADGKAEAGQADATAS